MKKLTFTLVAVLAFLMSQSQEEISIVDYKFTMAVAKSGLMDLKMGQLAIENSSSPNIKMLGERMIARHAKINKELKKLADQRGIFLLAGLNDQQQKSYRKLSGKKGINFDKAYAKMIARSHKHTMNAFEKEIKKGEDLELKGWALATMLSLESQVTDSNQSEDEIVMSKLEQLISYK